MSAEFKAAAAVEIEEFKFELRQRFPGRDVEHLTDEDLLREVMNTVGKPGKLGEGVRCVVSVSMLTEGGDANTVSHVLGVRAFGTQLLCEQVVGRGLRRRSYVVADDGRFEPEYAEVYGVPFSFIPPPGRGLTRSPARFPAGSGPWRTGSRARSPSPGWWGTAGRSPTSISRPTSSTSHAWRWTLATCQPGPTWPRSSVRSRSTALDGDEIGPHWIARHAVHDATHHLLDVRRLCDAL